MPLLELGGLLVMGDRLRQDLDLVASSLDRPLEIRRGRLLGSLAGLGGSLLDLLCPVLDVLRTLDHLSGCRREARPLSPSGGAGRLSDGQRPAMLVDERASPVIGLPSMAGQGMGGTDEAKDEALERLRALADEAVEQARRACKEAGRAAGAVTQAHQQGTSARVRATLAKRRELAAHARAIRLHEQAAMLQERLGHPDRAATARAHAEHARQLRAVTLQEQRDQER